jgi:iron complex transport system substrate-binding protein
MSVLMKSRSVLAIGILTLALGLSGCQRGGSSGTSSPSRSVAVTSPTAASFPVTLTDDDGVAVTLAEAPQRIITFAPSNTEIVFALGLGDRLVGVSGAYDDYPPEAKSIDQIGGSGDFGQNPNEERVVALHPDLMLAISGGEQWKEQLRALGIAVFTINATDFEDLLNDIRTVGALTGAATQAESLTQEMGSRADEIQAKLAAKPVVSCFFEAYYPPLTTVGPHTFIADLLARAGCRSVSDGADSDYPEWSVDRLVADSPDVYLVASESGVSPDAVAQRPGFGGIEAVQAGRVYLVDSDLISRPGPRVVDGLIALARLLHPEAFG